MSKQEKHLHLEEIEIPNIVEMDILTTIQQSIQILHQKELVKIEQPHQVVKDILWIYTRKSLLVQSTIAIILLIVMWLVVPYDNQNVIYALLVTGSSLMALTASFELLRSRLYELWELEQACPYSPCRLFAWKIALLSCIAFFAILFTALLLSSTMKQSFIMLLIGGCLPFLLLSAVSLRLQKYINSVYALLSLYGFTTLLFYLMTMKEWFSFLEQWGVWMLLATVLYMSYILWKQKQMVHDL